MGEGEELRVPAVVNLVLPARNEMPALVPLLSHKRCTHWLRIACTGGCAVARAIGDFPQSWLAERARCGTLARRSGEGNIWQAAGGSAAAGGRWLANGLGTPARRQPLGAKAVGQSKPPRPHATESGRPQPD